MLLQGIIIFPNYIDLLLPLVVIFSVKYGKMEALLYTSLLGFCQDSLYAVGFINTLAKAITVVFITVVKNYMSMDENKLVSTLAIIATILNYFVSKYSYAYFSGMKYAFVLQDAFYLLAQVILNILIVQLLLLVFAWAVRDEQ